MDQDQFLSLLCFVRDDVEGIQQVRSLKVAKRIICKLAEEGMSAGALLRRCCHLEFGEALIVEVQDHFARANQQKCFFSAMVQMPALWWDENELSPRRLLKLLRGHEVLAHLLAHHADLVTHPEHPLYCKTDISLADEYWAHQTRRFIVRGDFRRAWDELQKAHRGVLNATIQEGHFAEKQDFITECQRPENRCWRASDLIVGSLAIELYEAMVKESLLTVITDGDRLTDSWGRMRQTVYEVKMPSGHRHQPRAYSQSVPQPGHAIALLYGEHKPGSREVQLRDEGAAILKIAAHFNTVRNERRRKKHEQMLEEYESSKAN
ncbi:MAG: hypothetical protein AAB384_02130 [Patescibacteria group bacterium]